MSAFSRHLGKRGWIYLILILVGSYIFARPQAKWVIRMTVDAAIDVWNDIRPAADTLSSATTKVVGIDKTLKELKNAKDQKFSSRGKRGADSSESKSTPHDGQ